MNTRMFGIVTRNPPNKMRGIMKAGAAVVAVVMSEKRADAKLPTAAAA